MRGSRQMMGRLLELTVNSPRRARHVGIRNILKSCSPIHEEGERHSLQHSRVSPDKPERRRGQDPDKKHSHGFCYDCVLKDKVDPGAKRG